jgi:MFS family permease
VPEGYEGWADLVHRAAGRGRVRPADGGHDGSVTGHAERSEPEVVAPGRPGGRPLTALYLLTGVMSLGYGSVYTLLADIRDEFGFRDGDVGLIAFAGFLTGFVAQVALARFADRGHTALMLRAGVAVAAAGMAWTLVAEELWQWVGARLLLGLGSGTVGPAVRRLVIARDPEHVGANLGRQTAFDITGFVLGPLIAAVAAEAAGLRAPFAVLTVLYVAVLGVLLRFDLATGGVVGTRPGLRSLVARPAVQSALCASIALYLTVGMFEALWSVLLTDLGAETWLIGTTLSLFTVPMIVFAPRGGRAAQHRGPMAVVTVSITVAILCTLSYGLVPLWAVIAVSAVHAVADAYTFPGNQVAVAMSSPPDQLAAGQGLLGAVGLAVAGLTALAGGALYDGAGRAAAFGATAALMTVFLVAARWRHAAAVATASDAEAAVAPATG